jgi:hypothetical protein
MTVFPKRLRYTHRLFIQKTENTIFSGTIIPNMAISGYPTEEFKLSLTSSGICRIKIVGFLNGVSVTERISFSVPGTLYSVNIFDTVSSITSSYFVANTTIIIGAVDSVGMPISWSQTFGPFRAEFGSHSGMSAQLEANALGIGSKTVHYIRIERAAPLSKDMTVSIVGYDDQLWVPISDFENISTPPNYVPQEYAFRVVKKQDGD